MNIIVYMYGLFQILVKFDMRDLGLTLVCHFDF
jgi:hypothetical protein